MLSKFKIKSIRARITVYFSIVIIVIITSITFFNTNYFIQHYLEQKNNLVEEKTTLLGKDIEDKIAEFTKASLSLKKDFLFYDSFGGKEMRDNYMEISIKDTTNQLSGLQFIYLIPVDKLQDYESLLQIVGFQDFLDKHRESGFSLPHSFPNNDSKNIDPSLEKITYFYTIRDDKSLEVKAYLLMNIRRDYLFQINNLEENLNYLVIINRKKNLIYQDKGMDNTILEEIKNLNLKDHFINLNDYSFFLESIPSYPEWIAIGISSHKTLLQEAFVASFIFIAVGFLGIIIVILTSRYISKKITIQIYDMKEGMDVFKSGKIPEHLVPKTSDELGYLVNGFNSMIDNIKSLIDSIYKDQEEKKKFEIAALKYQLEALESQINPHFLYNTLNTVSYLAMKNKCNEIRELIQSLNMLLRSTLNNHNEFVTVEKEILFLKSYIKIQNYRYEEIIDIHFDIDENTLDKMILKLILQPLVENSLLHGIFPKAKKGNIYVSIHIVLNFLEVSIKDDGIGMDVETLKNIKDKKKNFNSIGLKNVEEKLYLYYGDVTKLQIYSTKDVGTEIYFKIPIKTEE